VDWLKRWAAAVAFGELQHGLDGGFTIIAPKTKEHMVAKNLRGAVASGMASGIGEQQLFPFCKGSYWHGDVKPPRDVVF
jgi:hypothetical protein